MGGGCQNTYHVLSLKRGLTLGGKKPWVFEVVVFSFLNKIFCCSPRIVWNRLENAGEEPKGKAGDFSRKVLGRGERGMIARDVTYPYSSQDNHK